MVQKYIVFDLDETLGNFVQLGIFCDVIESTLNIIITQTQFNELCDTFLKFFRPNLFYILDSIKRYKIQNTHIKLAIYTNNVGNHSWVNKLKLYMEHRANYDLFDRIICAYKNRDRFSKMS